MTARRTSTSTAPSITEYYVIPRDCPRLLQSYLKEEASPGEVVHSYYWLSQVDNATITPLEDPSCGGSMRHFDRSEKVRTYYWRKVAAPDNEFLYLRGEVGPRPSKLVEAPLEATTLNKVSPIAAEWQLQASKGKALDSSMWGRYGIVWPKQKRIKDGKRVPWTLAAAVKIDPSRVFVAWNGYAYWQLEKGGNQVIPIGLTIDQREAAKPWSTLRPRKPPMENIYRRRESV